MHDIRHTPARELGAAGVEAGLLIPGLVHDDPAALHHPANAVDEGMDVRERVALDGDDVGVEAGSDCAEVFPLAQEPGAVGGLAQGRVGVNPLAFPSAPRGKRV
jgi:hypothetical protein